MPKSARIRERGGRPKENLRERWRGRGLAEIGTGTETGKETEGEPSGTVAGTMLSLLVSQDLHDIFLREISVTGNLRGNEPL